MCNGDICTLTILKFLEDNFSADIETLLDECRKQMARAMKNRDDYLSSQDFNFSDSFEFLANEGFIELHDDKNREAILYISNRLTEDGNGFPPSAYPFNSKIVIAKKFRLLQYHLGLYLNELHDNYIYGKYVHKKNKIK
jgi:hypothetical protein